MGFRLLGLFAVVLALGQQPSDTKAAQDPQRPVFRGGTQLVRVDTYPTRDGKIIEGLTAADFEVYEDGKRQPLASADFIPYETIPDDDRGSVVSAREGLELAADSRYRVIVFVIDRESFDRQQWPAVRDSLVEFLEKEVTPRDLLALITTDHAWTDLVVGRRLSEIQRELDTPEWITPVMSEPSLVLLGCGMEGLQARIHPDETYALLEGIVRLLGQVREDRTSLVFVSNGLNRQMPDRRAADQQPLSMPAPTGLVNGHIQRVPRASDMHDEFCKTERRRLAETDFIRRFDDLVTLARGANVAFYPVAVPLLVPALPVARGTVIARTMPMVRVKVNGGLGSLASATDGLMISADGDVDIARGLRRITADAPPHYLLGYYSTNPKADGKIRKIEVRLAKTGSVVRARPYYRAPSPKDLKTLTATPSRPAVMAPPEVVAALDTLGRARPSAQFYTYVAVAGAMLTVVVEVPAEAVDAGRWSDGAALEVIAETDTGDASAMGRGRLAPTGRAVVRVPLTGPAPASVLVRVRAEGESLVQRTTPSSEPGHLVGDPLGYRSGPRGLAIPVALFEFTREEKLRLDYPLIEKVDRVDARILDRKGEPLRHQVSAAIHDAADGGHAVAELSFTSFGRGDYVVELTARAGAISERRLLGIRIR